MDYDKLIAPAAEAMRPSGIRKFFDLAADMPECISLGVGEPDFKTPWAVREAGIESLEHGRTRYTANAGLKELRAEICRYLERRMHLHCDPLREGSFCKEQASQFIADAALAVVVTADPLASDVWIEDASIASIYLQLQAEDMGLGSCWVQLRERFTASGMSSNEYVHEVLDMPLQLQALSIIAIGHKGMERKPFNEDNLQWEKIHLNKYGGK